MLNALIALLLVAVSLGLIAYVAALLLGAANLGARWERRRLEPYLARAERADRYLHEGDVESALTALRRALYPHPARTRELVETVRRHHLAILARLMAAADQGQQGGIRLMSLARADRLFQERATLQQQYLNALLQGGRPRRRQVREALRTNTNELRTALNSLSAEILAVQEKAHLH